MNSCTMDGAVLQTDVERRRVKCLGQLRVRTVARTAVAPEIAKALCHSAEKRGGLLDDMKMVAGVMMVVTRCSASNRMNRGRMPHTSGSPAPRPRASRGAWLIGVAAGRILRIGTLMRAPIWLYRARLGFVFGSRLLMLEHVGRRSGQRRHVVLEVVGRPALGTYVVASGFGTRSQWFRNVRANPQVRVAVGRHQLTPATARILAPDEAAASLQAYASHRPRTWRTFQSVLQNTLGRPVDDRATGLPMVALDLHLHGHQR